MRTKFIAALLTLIASIGVVGLSGDAAHADPPGCTQYGFCLHDTITSYPFFLSSGSAPRNTCFPEPADNIASFVTEHTGVQWWLFRTNDCGGSHIAVHAYTNLDLRLVSGWDNAVAAVMRTSTIG